ncbi:MAG: PKD domain-containing protein [Verrucomicrobia bacterium]|nr:PKD domain-containing protein [Verrucomicrobiota bacterium]
MVAFTLLAEDLAWSLPATPFKKLPRRLGHNNPILNEGTAPWNNWARVYEPMLDALAYSSVLTGQWTYPNGDIDAEPVVLTTPTCAPSSPISGGALVVGQHSNNAGTSAGGNNIPTANVPAWGTDAYAGITAIFALKPFSADRPFATFSYAEEDGIFTFDGTASESTHADATWHWDFGDGTTAEGEVVNHNWHASGRYLVTLRVSNAAGYSASSHRFFEVTTAQPEPSPYELWLEAFAISGAEGTAPTESYANDGISNLMRFAFGLGPLDPVPAEYMPRLELVNGTPTTLGVMKFRTRADAEGFTWSVEQSADLSTWSTVDTSALTPETLSDGYHQWTVDATPGETENAVFLRLILQAE